MFLQVLESEKKKKKRLRNSTAVASHGSQACVPNPENSLVAFSFTNSESF